MKKIITECLSKTGSAEQLDSMLNNFMLKPLEDTGLPVPDMNELISDARECLSEDYLEIEEADYKSHLAIRKLGREKQQKNGEASGKDIRKMAEYMAQVLSAYEEDISISVVSSAHEAKGRDIKFVISTEGEGEEPLSSMIRGVYGKVEAELVEMPKPYEIQMYATGNVVFRGKEAQKQSADKEFEKYEAWATGVLSSLPSDGNYQASLRFVPVSDNSSIREHCERLKDYYCRLKLYGNLNWVNNVNLGNSISEGKNTIIEMIGVDHAGFNAGYSMGISSQNINREAVALAEHIEHELDRLACAMQEIMWAVSISVCAEEVDTVQTLASIISGTLQQSDIFLTWSDSEVAPIPALTKEIMPLMMFPTKEFMGFSFVQNEEFSLSAHHSQKGFKIGDMLWNGTKISSFDMILKELSRHAFICGMTGSGKTNTIFKILEGVNLPFCVIEPVKGEYRALRSAYPDLQIWSMRVSDEKGSGVNIMQINPFWFPEGGNLAFHIDSLKTIIASSFELTAAMPNILEQCIYNIYIKAGWDLVTNRNIYAHKLPEEYLYPTFSDLCNEVEEYLNNSEFSADASGDYKGALLSRLKSFVSGYKGILLNTNVYPDYGKIMSGQSVLELEGLADDADKCLVMGTVLVQYYQYLKLNFSPSKEKIMQHLLVIEESHRLFKNTKNSRRGDGGADPTGQLVDSLSNMMAEIRAFGEGMLIIDQSPTKIAEDVIKNSATKIVHRIDNVNDIKALQSAMLLPDDILSFASLAQGEALIRTDGMEKPCKVKMLCSDIKEDYNLASSFKKSNLEKSALASVFAANSVLNNDAVSYSVQKTVIRFLNCITMGGMEKWYELIEDLLYNILTVLEKNRLSDIVDYKMDVLFEIISISIKRIYNEESKRNMGIVHMFVMRLLDFYREKRDGIFIKAGAINIFDAYLKKNVAEIVKDDFMKTIDASEHLSLCRAVGMDEEDMLAMMLNRYVMEIMPYIKAEKVKFDGDILMCNFLEDSVLFSLQSEIVEKNYSIFEKMAEYLSRLVEASCSEADLAMSIQALGGKDGSGLDW